MPTTANAPGPVVHFTEVILPRDPRSGLFDEAKRREIEGLLQRGTFKLVLREELPSNPNIVPSRFVLAIKREGNGEEVFKARFVLGGHIDKEKRNVVHSATTLKQSSIRIILALATIFGFDLWSTDINQAYLQSASNLRREIFVRPDVLELDKDQLLQVVKPLYGLSDAGDYWGETLTEQHLKELNMEQATGDFSLFFKRVLDKLTGLSGTYVDDILRAGTKGFENTSTTATCCFDSKSAEAVPFTFTGLQISGSKEKLKLSQARYIENLSLLSKDADFEFFRSMRAKLAWVVNSRPDIACAVAFSSQITPSTFDSTSYKLLNKIIKHLKASKELTLKFPKLDLDTLQLTV